MNGKVKKNETSFTKRLKASIDFYKGKPVSLLLRIAVYVGAIFTISVLLLIISYILIKGIPEIKPAMFEREYNTDNLSMLPAIINTLWITGMSLLVAVPFGVFSAVYLVEYAKRGNKLVKLVRVMAETLAGIPSIVYGLFGYLMFTIMFGGYSILGGSLTLAIMILPTIMRTTEEALKAVPDSFREGSFGLGAGRLRTVFRIIIPSAMPGILGGIILGIGRIVGETAALIYTAGAVAAIPDSVFDSGRTLAIHLYALSSEGLYMEAAYAVAAVLLFVVAGINALSAFVARKITLR